MELCARKILDSSLPTADSPPRRLLLPASLSTHVKKKWACGATNLPIGATAASQAAEQEIVEALIKELNSRLAVHLDTSISFDRNPAAPAWKPGRYIMVGASHASRTADVLAESGETVTKFTQPGWRITRPKVADMASKLHQLLEKEGADCTVVFEMLDSNFSWQKQRRVAWCQSAGGEAESTMWMGTWCSPQKSSSTVSSVMPYLSLR